MSINFNDNFNIKTGKPIEAKYYALNGLPYTSISAVNLEITLTYRFEGLTVNISNNEYWYKDGVDDSNLILKQADSSVSGATDTLITSPITNQILIYNEVNNKWENSDGDSLFILNSEKGSINGVAELDGTGKVPSTQLPAYVDDVLEYPDFASLPATGETGIIYITLDDNLQYRWSGTQYVEISKSLALGETSLTAYRGDHGLIAYNHSQLVTGNPHALNLTDIGESYSSINYWNTATGGINYSGGSVGIGTTTPIYKLDVNGTGRFLNSVIGITEDAEDNSTKFATTEWVNNQVTINSKWEDIVGGIAYPDGNIVVGNNITNANKITVYGNLEVKNFTHRNIEILPYGAIDLFEDLGVIKGASINARGESFFTYSVIGVTEDINDNSTKFSTTEWVKLQGYVTGSTQWDNVTGGINYSGGNVGIGIIPEELLHVDGAILLKNDNYIKWFDSAGTARNTIRTGADNIFRIQNNSLGVANPIAIHVGTSFEDGIYIDSNAKVGIGTTNPQGHLDINTESAEDTNVYINGEVGYAKYLKIRQFAASEAGLLNNLIYMGTPKDNYGTLGMRDATGTDIQVLHWGENGNVGIGDSTPSYKLDVNGTGRFTSNLDVQGILTLKEDSWHKSAGGDDKLYFSSVGHTYLKTNEDIIFKNASDISVGKYDYGLKGWGFTNSNTVNAVVSSLYTIYVTGKGYFSNTVTATNFILSSDIRLKENIIDANIIELPKIKEFNFINDESKRVRRGVIAQELEKVAPEMVHKDDKDMLAVDYTDFLLAKIVELENRINKLEDK